MDSIKMQSEIQISPKDGIKAEGYVSWAVILLIGFYIYMKYGHTKVKNKIATRKRRKKK
jgi:beta-glucosidase/6-phospho-beta-glucosidase/beta-galactosidase